jgi:hypothetical protein
MLDKRLLAGKNGRVLGGLVQILQVLLILRATVEFFPRRPPRAAREDFNCRPFCWVTSAASGSLSGVNKS